MRITTGQVALGDNFYPRPDVVEKIYRKLDASANIFLSAPRRVGKTSIMRFLADNPAPTYHFIYVLTQTEDTAEGFFRKLLVETLKSDAISQLYQTTEKTKSLIGEILSRVDSIELPWLKLDLQAKEQNGSYFQQFEKLLTQLQPGNNRIIIMVDEFPDTIENIKEKEGVFAAATFLYQNRDLRQNVHPNIRFMYTGSIGLPLVVKKIQTLNVIGDLSTVEVPPLSKIQAKDLAQRIFTTYDMRYDDATLETLLSKLDWWIPFHIQLFVNELIDLHGQGGQISNESVDKAFNELLHVRNDIYFNHYHSRLDKSFPDAPSRQFAQVFLNTLAHKTAITVAELEALARRFHPLEYSTIIDSLVFDGYVSHAIDRQEYTFTSHLLRSWWFKKRL